MFFSSKFLLLLLKLLLIFLCSFFISLLFALIHIVLTINIISAIFGISLLISSIIVFLWNKNIASNKYRLEPIKQVEAILNNRSIVKKTAETTVKTTVHRTVNTDGSSYVDTGGGNYNKEVRGDYVQGHSIGGDLVTKNITIGGQEVEISSDYSETLGDLKEILNEMIVQSSNVVEAISHFAEELIEELRKQPEIKVSLNAKRDSGEQELVNKIIIDLLTKSYDDISQINQIIQTHQIIRTNQNHNLSNSRNLEYVDVEYYIHNQSDRDIKEYNGYKIHLAKDHDNMWSFKIEREGSNFLDLGKQNRTKSKDHAIGKAKKIIDQDRIQHWKSIKTSG